MNKIKHFLSILCCWRYGHAWSLNPVIICFRAPKGKVYTTNNGVAQYFRWCVCCGRQEARWADETKWVVDGPRSIPIDFSEK